MASIRDIKRQIASVKSTQKITKAMEMVSVAKMRKAIDSMGTATPYYNKYNDLVLNLLKTIKQKQDIGTLDNNYENPFILNQARDSKNIGVLVVTSDKGLCGAFNSNIIKMAKAFVDNNPNKSIKFYIVGKVAYDSLKSMGHEIGGQWLSLSGKVTYEAGKDIASSIIYDYLQKNIDELHIAYYKYISANIQKPTLEKILPLTAEYIEANASHIGKSDSDIDIDIDFLFEPVAETVFENMLPGYIVALIYYKLIESSISEHRARMIAVESATRNADEMVKKLQLYYNKARQDDITTDLLDIINGAEALK